MRLTMNKSFQVEYYLIFFFCFISKIKFQINYVRLCQIFINYRMVVYTIR